MDAVITSPAAAAPAGGNTRQGLPLPAPPKLGARRQLSAEVEALVREMIMTGRLRAGEHIRTDKLAEELGISQTPVREGLQALRGQGFLNLEPRKGFRVLELRRSDIDDIFTAQAHLAAELARRATSRLSAEQIDELSRLDKELDEAAAADDGEAVQALDWAFHRLINLNADSPKLKLLLSVALFYVPRTLFRTNLVYPPAEGRAEIIAAIRDRDEIRAAEAMHRHIEAYGKGLQGYLDAGGVLPST
jgi:DNA-binding GntR family transcriptional regulator